jgi:hypothetical protein
MLIKKTHIENGFRPINIIMEEEKDNDFPEKVYIFILRNFTK